MQVSWYPRVQFKVRVFHALVVTGTVLLSYSHRRLGATTVTRSRRNARLDQSLCRRRAKNGGLTYSITCARFQSPFRPAPAQNPAPPAPPLLLSMVYNYTTRTRSHTSLSSSGCACPPGTTSLSLLARALVSFNLGAHAQRRYGS